MRPAIIASMLVGLAVAVLFRADFSRAQPDNNPLLVAPTGPRTPEEERKGFHLPPGFEIELVAAEPEIKKPMNLAFDDRGRLWVTDTVEYPFPAKEGTKPRDSVKILEDTNGDGRADKVTTFADELNIPIGVIPLTPHPSPPEGRGGTGYGAIVYSIPYIYRLTDTDGDDKADKREVLYSTFGYQDTHGMASSFSWGFDGWLYATHGFANTSKVKAGDGGMVTMNSGNTFRMKADGSRVEQFTWGQVNPFGLTFTPRGDLFSADCHSRPVMMLLRGGYYQSFGKPHDGLGFAPEICAHDHGSTGIAGIVYYAADHFPAEYRQNLFVGNPVTNRINRDTLRASGSTLTAVEQPDFLKSDDPWFRPVDLELGPDGALYVADFYNKIIGHYEVPLTHPGRDRDRGRIWRIVYRGPDGKGKPAAPRKDWTKASVAELVQDLDHANLKVRIKAANQLVERGGKEIVEAVRQVWAKGSPVQRTHALWVLERLAALDDATLAETAKDADATVRVHAMRVLSERSRLTETLTKLARAGLKDADPFVQRAAAGALGRHPAKENIRMLLDLRHAVPKEDTQLLHTVRIALRNQFRDNVDFPDTTDLVSKDTDTLIDIALGVPTEQSAIFLGRLLYRANLAPSPPDQVFPAIRHFTRYGRKDDVKHFTEQLVRWKAGGGELPVEMKLFKAVQQGWQERGEPLPEHDRKWAHGLSGRLMAAKEADLIQGGAELAGSLKLDSQQHAVAKLLGRKDLPEGPRRAAVTALAAINPKANVSALGRVLADSSEPPGLQDHTANTLAGLNLPEARAELVKALTTAPARQANVLAASLAGSKEGAEQLLDAVAAGKASPRLLQERAVLVRMQPAKPAKLEERLAELTKGLPAADQRLQALMGQRRGGYQAAKPDVTQGLKIYEKNCAICHQIAGKGAKIGPQLDGIGARGLDRLLEDLLDPNRNVDQAFRASLILTEGGQTINGLVLREEGEVVVVADAQGKEVRVPKSEIAKRSLSALSPMPANLNDTLNEAEFYHLMGYLLTQRPQ